ncbi:MAG: hypothetical protein L0226_05305 [Acidobacteria bacterium]|nr:hypothetical protein [Acidobacteriota bacterium]
MAKFGNLLAGRSKGDAAALIILLALVTISWLPRFRGPIDFRWDAGVYYILGTSLAEGKGYRLLNEPGEIKAIQYPPLLPALIAAHQLVFKTSDPIVVGHGLRLSFFVLFVIHIFAIYALARHYLQPGYAFLATLVCLFNFFTHFLSDACFPEIAFALTTILFVLCHKKGGRTFSVMAAILAVMAYALRTVGVSLIAAWIVEGLLNRKYKIAAQRLSLLLIVVAGWQYYIRSVEIEPEYRQPAYTYQRADYLFYNVSYARNVFLRDPFSSGSGHVSAVELAGRLLRNLAQTPMRLVVAVTSDRYFWEARRTAVNARLGIDLIPAWVIDAALVLLGLLILGGVGLQLARRQWIIPCYLLFSLASLSLTPWPGQFTRYYAPLAPFLTLSLFLTLDTITGFLRRIWPQMRKEINIILVGSVVSLILLVDGLTFVMIYREMHQNVAYVDQKGKIVTYRLFFYKDAYRALDAGLDWLKQWSKPDDVVASSMPHWVYLRTRLRAVMPPFETDPFRAQELLDSVPVTFIIQDRGLDLDTRKYLSPVVHTFPERWKLVYSDSITDAPEKMPPLRFEIYQRVGLPRTVSKDFKRDP